MTKTLTMAFRKALRYAATSIRVLAEEADYSAPMYDEYLNRRPPSRAAALALAGALDARARKLREHAERLRAAAGEAGG